MEQSRVLKSKQLPLWYLSTVVGEYRYVGWRGGGGGVSSAGRSPGPVLPTHQGCALAPTQAGPPQGPLLCGVGQPAENGVRTTDPECGESQPHWPLVLRGCGLPDGQDPGTVEAVVSRSLMGNFMALSRSSSPLLPILSFWSLPQVSLWTYSSLPRSLLSQPHAD